MRSTFWAHTNRSTTQQKLFQIALPQKVGALEITEKESQKRRTKLKNMYILTENICSDCNPMQVVVFLQKCINLAEPLKISQFEGSIIH